MPLPMLLSSLLSFAAADSSALPAGSSPERSPLTKEAKADSAWNRETWSLEAGYSQGIAWGDLRDGEDDMAGAVGLTFSRRGETSSPLVLLQNYGLAAGVWRNFGERGQIGLGIDQGWTFVVAGQPGIDFLLWSDALLVRARYWWFRRLNWQIGPVLGVGPAWSFLTRYGMEKGASYSASAVNVAETQRILAEGSRTLALAGWRLDAGLAMEVRILPLCSIGGALQLKRLGMTFVSDDPVQGELLRAGLPYASHPVQWEAGLELHAAYRF